MKKIIFIIIILLFVSCSKEGVENAKVRNYSGAVTVNGKAISASGISINAGDVIKTMEGAFCEVVIGKKSVIMIRANSDFVYNLSGKVNSIELRRGWLAGVTKKIFTGKKRERFLIKTPTITAGVRGTSFCIKVENRDSTYFCVCNGEIVLEGTDKSVNEKVTAPHHIARRFIRDENGVLKKENNPGMLYHGDELIENLAGSIGERIDWTKPDKH